MADSASNVVTPVVVDSPLPSTEVSPPDLSVDPSVPGTTTPSKIDSGFQELNNVFGIDSSNIQNNEAASAALRPVINMIAQTGMNHNVTPWNQLAPPPRNDGPGQLAPPPSNDGPGQLAPPTLPDFSFKGVDFGEAGPEVEKAFKQMGEQNQSALKQIMGEVQSANQAAEEAKQSYLDSGRQQVAAYEQQVVDRASSYIDSLQSPKYGVGQNRTMVQQMASAQVMGVAKNLMRGWPSYGQTPPIETIMQAAVFFIEGQVPTAPTPSETPTPALTQQTASGIAPAVVRGTGSAGGADSLMGDKEFLDGGRAILAR